MAFYNMTARHCVDKFLLLNAHFRNDKQTSFSSVTICYCITHCFVKLLAVFPFLILFQTDIELRHITIYQMLAAIFQVTSAEQSCNDFVNQCVLDVDGLRFYDVYVMFYMF